MADLVVQNGIGYKRRNPWGVLGLSIITFGVYYVVWWYKINNEMNNLGVQCNPTSSVLAITIGAFVVVPPFISIYATADRIKQAQERTNASERMVPVLGLLLFIVVSTFAAVYYQSQLNKAWDALAAAGAEVHPA
jgi:drug/metabolite transporter (DMT)-like permease